MTTWRVPVLTVLLVGLLEPGVSSAQSLVDGACPRGDGVTVVVDFGTSDEPALVRCGRGIIDNGLDVLAEARIAYDIRGGDPNVICRIEALPGDRACGEDEASSGDAWTYWSAEPGGTWRAVDGGPLDRDPPEGSVDGWALTSTSDPSPPTTPPPPPGEDRPDPDPPVPSGAATTPAGDGATGPDDEGTGPDDAPGSSTSDDENPGTAAATDDEGPPASASGAGARRERVDTDGDGEPDAVADVVRDADGDVVSVVVDTDGDGEPDAAGEVTDDGEVLAVRPPPPEGGIESTGAWVALGSLTALAGAAVLVRRRGRGA